MTGKWEQEVSEKTREILDGIGSFKPVVSGVFVKGWMNGEKTYLDSNDLREYANAMLEAAAWLDRNKTI